MTRTIQINFQTKTPSSYDLGYIGEHNATEITFIPSDELKNDPRTAAYYLAFDTGGHIIPSEVKRINEPFSVTLQQQLTKNHCMSIQLIAVDTEENFIGKTEFLRGFHFKASAKEFNTEPIEDDDVLLAEIHANTAARHTHSNKYLLDTYSQTENDLADAVNKKHTHSNKDFLDTLNQETLDEKVDKIPGKGLSANDFTDAKKQKLEATNIFFGTCLTAAGTTKKTIITDSQFELREGVTLVVYFFDGCSVAIPVFNVNSTGEHSAYRNYDSTSELAISRIYAGGIGVFVYYNGRWYQPNLFNANGTNYGVVSLSDSTNSASDATRGIAATPKAVKTVADIAKAKQDPIADLQAIRSGAALGATATQPSDLEAEVTAREDADTELQDQINNLKARGRFLSLWNATTGLAMSEPSVNPYEYRTGDYFIVEVVGTTNYKPSGTQYDKDVPSTAVETNALAQGDSYFFDGTTWILQKNTQVEISFSSVAGSPFDNTALASVLNSKVDKVTGKGLSSEDYTTAEKSKLAGISANAKNVSVSASGTATDEVGYITVDGVEKKLAGGSKTTIVETIEDAPENPQIGDRITVLQDGSTDSVPMSAVIGLINALNGKQNLLPSGTNNGDILLWDTSQNKYVSKPKWQMIYQPVEYIESTGTQYINTAIVADGIDIRFKHTNLDNNNIFGSDNNDYSSTTWKRFAENLYGDYFQITYGNTDTSFALIIPEDTNWHTVQSGKKFSTIIFDNIDRELDLTSANAGVVNMFLFALNDGREAMYKVRGLISYCKLYQGTVLVRDFQPVYNIFTGEIGLFDKVNNKFYGNNGSGTFLKGGDV